MVVILSIHFFASNHLHGPQWDAIAVPEGITCLIFLHHPFPFKCLQELCLAIAFFVFSFEKRLSSNSLHGSHWVAVCRRFPSLLHQPFCMCLQFPYLERASLFSIISFSTSQGFSVKCFFQSIVSRRPREYRLSFFFGILQLQSIRKQEM